MTKEELKDLLKQNLEIKLKKKYNLPVSGATYLQIVFDGEVIDEVKIADEDVTMQLL